METHHHPEHHAQHHPAAHPNTLMAVLAYIGPLVIVSYLVAKDDPFVKFHIKQGLVLFAIEVILWFIGSFFGFIFYSLWALLDLVNLAVLVLAIIGIVNAVQGKEQELPLVGSYGASFRI